MNADAVSVSLRVLETSDLHMFVYDYDYYNARQDNSVGLAKVATLIAQARREVPNSVLFDNGDIIQGNPLGDYMALPGHLNGRDGHPMFRAMNRLGYDGATLGNHEFNYGLDFLHNAMKTASFPFVCANVTLPGGGTLLPPTMVIERKVTDTEGRPHTLRIGLIGLVTPQIMVWDRAHLQGKVQAGDIVGTARTLVPALRKSCDLLIALCHSGIAGGAPVAGAENAALQLATVPGIDVILTGHAHRVFPGPDYAGIDGADVVRGRLGGVPAVMPGFWGSHLGVVDLSLRRDGAGRWSVEDAQVEARPIYRREGRQAIPLVVDDRAILDAARPEHEATLRWMDQPVGRTTVPINTFLSVIGNDAALSLINQAQLWYAAPLVAGTPYAHLPLLSAASPFKAGGSGPDSFVDIPAGPMDMKDIANLYMFANTVCVVKLNGAELRDWLERSVNLFAQVDPTQDAPQPLLAPQPATYLFDTIAGLRYEVDLTQPARFDRDGKLCAATAHRITALSHDGRPVQPEDEFLVVTNNYRAAGGGGFAGTGGDHVVLNAPDLARDVLIRFVTQAHSVSPTPEPIWHFKPFPKPVSLVFNGNAETANHLDGRGDIRRLGDGEGGFVRYALTVA
ncbi:bifunctional 2',3'-cyclic-nucleotide 2'-phosphodiesterase/3'-nucleotidase [Acetobacteraceae bacterium KSS8]|uniref:Bifunctional 2',3'-cyclic-nucleotide 2'-phosphodiesterase/3'-nucleotidase n=1 Tax=Endosaccharibacter trunci TaxID=2812733 RepID=A0ABT1WA87_9PROT|nr:bifunctional 2',3'-cyclic-nucleotide 2'-phosphodiesterase/3'-nucleotidase [Acetobacteraceae bacterium KSS8]